MRSKRLFFKSNLEYIKIKVLLINSEALISDSNHDLNFFGLATRIHNVITDKKDLSKTLLRINRPLK